MNNRNPKITATLSIILFALLTGCDASEPSESLNVDGGADASHSSNDVETDADEPNSFERLHKCWQQHDQSESPEFEKPDCESLGERKFERPEDWDVEVGSETWVYQGVHGRSHMRSTNQVRESWLYPDEPFVTDGFHLILGGSEEQVDYTISVLVEGEPVPFKWIHVDVFDGYPSLDEISRFTPADFDSSASITLTNKEPHNFSLVIPPSSFSDEGAYNVQALFVRDFEPDSEKKGLRDVSPFHRTHTVYYGSEEFGESAAMDRRQPNTTDWHRTERNLILRTTGMLLTPPRDIYDLTEVEHARDVHLAQEFSTAGEEINLNLHAGGVDKRSSNTTEENLYVVVRNGTPIRSFFARPHDVSQYEVVEFTEGDDPGTVFPIESRAAADTAEYQVIVFPYPDKPHTYDMDVRPIVSNAIFLSSSPE